MQGADRSIGADIQPPHDEQGGQPPSDHNGAGAGGGGEDPDQAQHQDTTAGQTGHPDDTAAADPSQSIPPQTPNNRPTAGGGVGASTAGRTGGGGGTKYSDVVREQQVQDYGAGKKGAHIHLLAIMAVVSLCMVIASMITNIYTKTTIDWSVRISMWYNELCHEGICTSTALPDGSCEAEKARYRAIQAFVIVTLLSNLLAIAVALSDIFQRCPWEKLPLVTFGLLHFFTLFTWAMIAGGYHATHCDNVASLSNQDYKMSVSFSLLLCLWMMQFFILVFYFVKRFLGAYQRRAMDHWVGAKQNQNQSIYSTTGGRGDHSRYSNRTLSPSASRRDRRLEEGGAYSGSRSRTKSNFSQMTDALLGKQEMNSTVHHR